MRTIVLILALASSGALAEVYECSPGVFQAEPCSIDSKPLELRQGSNVEYRVPPKVEYEPAVEEKPSTDMTNNHPCYGKKIPRDAIRWRHLAICMTESQMLSIAGPQQYNVYEYYKDGKHYKEYRFTEPRYGFPSYAIVEGGYVVDPGGSKSFSNSQ